MAATRYIQLQWNDPRLVTIVCYSTGCTMCHFHGSTCTCPLLRCNHGCSAGFQILNLRYHTQPTQLNIAKLLGWESSWDVHVISKWRWFPEHRMEMANLMDMLSLWSFIITHARWSKFKYHISLFSLGDFPYNIFPTILTVFFCKGANLKNPLSLTLSWASHWPQKTQRPFRFAKRRTPSYLQNDIQIGASDAEVPSVWGRFGVGWWWW